MAVARFILASITIAVVFATAEKLDCPNVFRPSDAINFYAPPVACRNTAHLKPCYTQWQQCVAKAEEGAGIDCNQLIDGCVPGLLQCLYNVPGNTEITNSTDPCYNWADTFNNVKMYLDMGGAYSGSTLHRACKYGSCHYVAHAPCKIPTASCDAPPVAATPAPTAVPGSINCSARNGHSHYQPPQACVDADQGVKRCVEKRSACAANVTGCLSRTKCIRQYVHCMNNLPASSRATDCTEWRTTLDEALSSLQAGATYAGSFLEKACEEVTCRADLGGVCDRIGSRVCAKPRKAPRFGIRFGGSVWAALLADSTKKNRLLVLVTRGLARLLKISEHVIQVLSMSSGSLVVEFYLLEDESDGNAVSQQLAAAAQDSSVLASAFSELQDEVGIDIDVTELTTTGDDSVTLSPLFQPDTPAPPGTTSAPATPSPATPEPNSAGLASVTMAALITFLVVGFA